MAFRKKRKQSQEADAAAMADDAAEEAAEPERPGPRDSSEVDEGGAYLDFGGLRIPALPGRHTFRQAGTNGQVPSMDILTLNSTTPSTKTAN